MQTWMNARLSRPAITSVSTTSAITRVAATKASNCTDSLTAPVRSLCTHLRPGALNLQGIEFARKGGGNCTERNVQGKAPQFASL